MTPRFSYVVKSQPHQSIQGQIEAESEQDAVGKLTKMGYFPVSVKTEAMALSGAGTFGLKKTLDKFPHI